MQEPSAPPLPYNVPIAQPSNPINNGYTIMHNEQYNNLNTTNDEVLARNLHHQLNNNNIMPNSQPQVIVINDKQNTDADIIKVGCAAALFTFCCMQ